jgi:hypothetical protein
MLSICSSVYALPGKQEFVMLYPGEEIHFINDGEYLYVLNSKPDEDSSDLDVQSCIVAPMSGNEVTVGKNKIVFYEEFAIVNNKKKRFYVGKKTDLLFYRHLCKKPKN